MTMSPNQDRWNDRRLMPVCARSVSLHRVPMVARFRVPRPKPRIVAGKVPRCSLCGNYMVLIPKGVAVQARVPHTAAEGPHVWACGQCFIGTAMETPGGRAAAVAAFADTYFDQP